MTKFKLIGAAALSLLVAAPAAATPPRDHHRHAYSHGLSRSFGHGSAYEAYGFDRSGDVSRGNISADFDRRNTFN
jgi:hypothetical protein